MSKNYLLTVTRFVMLVGALSLISSHTAWGQKPPAPVTVQNTPLPVTVENTTADPLPTRDVDNPARQPVTFHLSELANEGQASAGLSSGFTPPAGKRLVVEFVSGFLSLPTGQNAFAEIFSIGPNGGFFHALVPVATGDFPAFARPNIFSMSQQLRLYSESSGPLQIGFTRNGTTGTALLQLTFSGYLVAQ